MTSCELGMNESELIKSLEGSTDTKLHISGTGGLPVGTMLVFAVRSPLET